MLGSTIFGLKANLIGVFSFLSATVFPAVITGLRAISLAVITNPIGLLIAGLVTGAALVITNWQKVKEFFASFWEYIKSIIKPIGEAFSWMGSTVSSIFGKISKDSPIKEFKNKGTVVNTLSKNSIFSNGDPLLGNSAIKGISGRKSNFEKFKVTDEKRSVEDYKTDMELIKNRFEGKESKMYNQTFNQTFNISVKAEPNQDVRSIADAVIERFREQARSALFDTIEELH